MPRSSTKTPGLLAAWLLVCAFLNCAGWALSALHQLNLAGYTACLLIGAAAVILLRRKGLLPGAPAFQLRRLRSRFSRLYPAAFLGLAVLVLLGGLLHPPSNYDGLAYREPRVLHWLAEGRWHWIHTDFQRLNVRACGFEWLSAPFMLFTRTDRFVFLINFVSFLLLPGAVFSAFVWLGIRPRAAWYWMWLVPSGYCFVLQAGSIANDSFAAVFALAALVFAFRARAFGRIVDLWMSGLAAALLTGSKSSNLPLLLPWFIAILPSIPLIFRNLAPTLGVGLAAAACSFLPVAVLNWAHCRDWSGQAAEQALFKKTHPILHLENNALLIAAQNVVPPVFPLAGAWNRLIRTILPPDRVGKLEDIFEPGAVYLELPDLQTEESAGLGLGVSLLAVSSFLATSLSRRGPGRPVLSARQRLFRAAILASVWLTLLPLMAVSGSATPARYLAPQYVLLLPVLLLGQSGDWIRHCRWWRWASVLVFLMAAGLVIVSPARPLWPARSVLSGLDSHGSRLLERAQIVYAVYGERADAFARVRELLPGDATTVGMVTFDDPETSLWRPFGSRRVHHVLPQDSRQTLDEQGIKYVLVNSHTFSQRFTMPLDQWQAGLRADLVEKLSLKLKASLDPCGWYLMRLQPAETKSL
jgi:hypothetical protein